MNLARVMCILIFIVSLTGFIQIILNKQFIYNGIIYILIFLLSLALSITIPIQNKNNNSSTQK